MNELLVLKTIYNINTIICIVTFCLMVNKIYDRKKLIKKLDYILIFIIGIFIIITPEFIYTYEYCIYKGLLLALLSKKIFEIYLKDAFVFGICFSFGCAILIDTINYLYLIGLMEAIIKEYKPVSDLLYKTITLSVILILLLKYFDKIINLSLSVKYYIYIICVLITNVVCVLSLVKSNSHIMEIYDFIIKNKVNTYVGKDNFIELGFIPFIEFTKNSVIISIIFCNVFLIVIINRIIKNMKDESEIKALNDKLDMQYNHYLSIQESQMKVRKLYHDINNHMSCIRRIENQDVNEYIDSINEELRGYKTTFNTENMILDIILNEKKFLCDKNNIELFCDMNFLKCDFIEMIDTSSIFSNILDNAIEACKKVEDNRYINIRGTVVKSYYIIKCENSKNNEVKIKNKKIITSKKDKFLHGIGLKSIKSSLSKYNGDLEIIDEENKFTINIYIPID